MPRAASIASMDRFRSIVPMTVAAVIIFGSGCSTQRARSPAATPVSHIVICWLKEPGNPAARAELIRVSRSFADIPGVTTVRAGTVLPSGRQVVDGSYDVAIVMSFTDGNALAEYQSHPRHKQAVKDTLQPLVRKMIIYDFVEDE